MAASQCTAPALNSAMAVEPSDNVKPEKKKRQTKKNQDRRVAFSSERMQNFNRKKMLQEYGLEQSEIEAEGRVPFTSILAPLPSPTPARSGPDSLDDRPTCLADIRKVFIKALAPPAPVGPLSVCGKPSRRAKTIFRTHLN